MMTTTATLAHTLVRTGPRSFTPPGDRTLRLSHLDPRPLWREDAVVKTPWTSPTFWLAWTIVAPLAGAVGLLRKIR